MQSSSKFTRISGLISKVKKYASIKDYENIVAYSKQSEQNEGVGEQVWCVLNLFGGSECWCYPMKIDYFYFHLSLETVFPERKMTQIVIYM